MRELVGLAEQNVLRWFGLMEKIEKDSEDSRIQCERC